VIGDNRIGGEEGQPIDPDLRDLDAVESVPVDVGQAGRRRVPAVVSPAG